MSTSDEATADPDPEVPAYSSVEVMAAPTETTVTVEGWPSNDYCKITLLADPGEGRVTASLLLSEDETRRVARALLEEAENMGGKDDG
jgi:hypothetical protein